MEFVNTFENGLHLDNSIELQPKGTVRFLKNYNLIQSGSNFVVKDVLGNVLTFTINKRYAADETTFSTPPTVIGMISTIGRLIVLTTPGEIGEVKYDPYGNGVKPKSETGQLNAGYTPLYHDSSLNFSVDHAIEGFGFMESDEIERIYFSDNNNDPRVFNTADPVYTNYLTTLSSASGTEYMVLEGAIEYPTGSGNYYGPTDGTGSISGNIFSVDGVNTTFTDLTAPSVTAKVIKRVPYQLLSWTPERLTGSLKFSEFGTGTVYCGSKVYFYRQGLNSGYKTGWSYGSSPIQVGKDNTYFGGSGYQNWVGAGTSTTLEQSVKSVKISIEGIDQKFDYVELACAEFDQVNELPRQITIVDKKDIAGTSMILEHNGSINLGVLSTQDITLFPAHILKIKTLATNKSYMIVGNVTERDELDISFSGVTITSKEYRMLVYEDALACSSDFTYPDVSPTSGANPLSGEIRPDTRWEVGGTGTVTYNAVTYSSGQIFTGVVGALTYTTSGSPTIRPVVTKNKYTPIGTSQRREDYIELKGDACHWDYKSAAVRSHVLGYWSNEKYRFGILLYDLKGAPFYVRWIGDYTFPHADTKKLLKSDTSSGVDYIRLNASLAKISGIRIPQEFVGQISGFSIVRAPRDPKIITQGLVVQCSLESGTPNIVRPIAWVQGTYDKNGVADKTYQYICPDSLVNSPFKSEYAVSSGYMEAAQWLAPYNFGGGDVVRSNGGIDRIVTKHITCRVPDSIRPNIRVSNFLDGVLENQYVNFDGSNDFQNALQTGATTPTVTVCGSATSSTLANRYSIGGKRDVFSLDSDFGNYGTPATLYTSSGSLSLADKVLMNYCKSAPNQYGGASEDAIANTIYISTGHFQSINSTVISETCNTGNPASYSYLEFNDVEIAGGDCYLNLVDYGYGLWSNSFGASNTYSYGWMFPCESNVNYGLRRGRKTSNVGMFYNGITGYPDSIAYLDTSSAVRLEDFSYNQAYNSEGIAFAYPALPTNYSKSGRFPSRTRFAGPKFLGETIDSFRLFSSLDFHDMDVRVGEINKIAIKDDRVIVWQNKGASTVPVLERQILSGLDGAPTALGTGGVIDRHDLISSAFGTQHQWSVTETEFGYIWFDMRKKSICVFDSGVYEVSLPLGISSYLNEAFNEIYGSGIASGTPVLNSPTYDSISDRPLKGVGIIGAYDPKFKTAYLIFKFKNYKMDGSLKAISKDFTIAYYYPKKMFVGFFDWFPSITVTHNQLLVSANNPKNTSQYLPTSGSINGYTFTVGETVSYLGAEHVCIKDVMVDSGSANTIPGYTGGGVRFWQEINSPNQLWVHNQPKSLSDSVVPDYQYNIFFGKVVDNETTFIVNPQTRYPFNVQCIEQDSNGVYDTNVTTECADKTASDLNIRSTDKNYRYINGKLCHNLPNSDEGRIVGDYLQITLFKKNWTTPTVMTGNVKTLKSVLSKFIQRP